MVIARSLGGASNDSNGGTMDTGQSVTSLLSGQQCRHRTGQTAVGHLGRTLRRIVLTTAVAAIELTGPAFAESTTNWTGSSSTDWFTSGNWDNGVPTDADTANIETASPNDTVISDQTTNGTATVDILDIEGTGSLTIESGGYLNVTVGVEVSGQSGSTAILTVTGSSSTLELGANGVLLLGEGGYATLIVADGGEITGDTAGLTVSDALLVIGGQTTAATPGTITLPAITFNSAAGEILFNHTATEADGYTLAASITANNASINVTSGYTTLSGDLSGLAGTITVDGGTLAVSNDLGTSADGTSATTTLLVGDTGTDAAFVVQDGGNVSITEDATIGNQAGSSGTVTVTGSDGDNASTLSVDGTLYVGNESSGTLVVAEGGVVAGTIEIAKSSGSTGVVAFGALAGDAAAGSPGAVPAALTFGSGTSSIVFNHTASSSDPFELSGAISGNGPIDVVSGYTDLSGSSTSFSGTVAVDGGSLIVSGTLNASTLTVDGGTTDVGFSVEDEGVASISDSMVIGSQSGSSGIAVVSGSDASSGSTVRSTLKAKSLTVGDRSTGTLVVSNGGEVEINGGSSALSIAEKTGSTGTFAVGAASGDTPLGTGILKASEVTFGGGTGTVLFNHADDSGDYAFSLEISGAGTIVAESGYTSLTSKLTSFTGTTEVEGGSLSVDTTLPGDVNVTGGTLLGTGTLSGLATIEDGGTIAAGNSVGTLNTADVTFNSGSVYAVEIDSDGNTDLIKSTGTVTINGGEVDVTSDVYYANQTFTIITADTIDGQFDEATGATTFITYTLDYTGSSGAESVELTQSVNQSFSSVTAPTPNEQAVAGALDSLLTANVTHEVIQTLLGSMSEEEALAGFNQLSGEGHASQNGALVENGQQVVNSLYSRLHGGAGAYGGSSSMAFAYDGPAQALATAGPDNSLWVAPYGNWLHTDGTANTAAFDRYRRRHRRRRRSLDQRSRSPRRARRVCPYGHLQRRQRLRRKDRQRDHRRLWRL